MRHHDNCLALLVQTLNNLHDLHAFLIILSGGRLIQDQDICFKRQYRCKGYPLPLTPAQSEGIPGKYTVKAKKSGNLPDSFINQLRLAFDIDQSKPYLIVDCVAKI